MKFKLQVMGCFQFELAVSWFLVVHPRLLAVYVWERESVKISIIAISRLCCYFS